MNTLKKEIEELREECSMLSMLSSSLDSKLSKLEKENKKLKKKNKLLVMEIEATDRQVNILTDGLGESTRKNEELIAQVSSAKVHTINGSCYIKCADVHPYNSKKALDTLKCLAIVEASERLPHTKDEDGDVSFKRSDLIAYSNRLLEEVGDEIEKQSDENNNNLVRDHKKEI